MSKVTSKLQVTIPRAIAEAYDIEPGDSIEFVPAGEAIRVVPPRAPQSQRLARDERLRLFDEATERQTRRDAARLGSNSQPPATRVWTREELYERGSSD